MAESCTMVAQLRICDLPRTLYGRSSQKGTTRNSSSLTDIRDGRAALGSEAIHEVSSCAAREA